MMIRVSLCAAVLSGALCAFSTRAQPCDPFWQPMGAGVTSVVRSFFLWDADQGGPIEAVLLVGGNFSQAGGAPASRIARWDGTSWSPMGLGVNSEVRAMRLWDPDGGGAEPPMLVIAGFFTNTGGTPAYHVAYWNGSGWSEFGGGVGHANGDTVVALATWDDDGDGVDSLYVGGFFFDAGGAPALDIAEWTGAGWDDMNGGTNNTVTSLYVFDDDGEGPHPSALYVSGGGSTIGANGIARWDGQNWFHLGSGTNGAISGMIAYDDDGTGGNPPALYVGGSFTSAGGEPAGNIAKWDGQNWHAVGGGTDLNVLTLAVFDEDGSGGEKESLYAGGNFTTAGGQVVNQVARWDGAAWHDLDGGANSQVGGLYAVERRFGGHPRTLFAGGFFSTIGGVSAARVAAWVGCGDTNPGDMNCDDSLNAFDIQGFVTALEDPADYKKQYPDCDRNNADMNGDGSVNAFDIQGFIDALGG